MKRNHSRLFFWITVLLCSVLAGACSALEQPAAPDAIWPGVEWPSSSPEEQGMDPELLDLMMDLIDENEVAIDSVLVIRNGYLVFEEYRRNWKPTSRHHLQSVTKSFTSTLVGIALQEGFLEDTGQLLVDLYPEREIANLDPRKQAITLKDLLTMSEGMDWHEIDLPYDHPDNSLGQMWTKADVIQHVLDTPMARDPGLAWNYNSGTSMLLGNIVEEASGQDILSFAQEYLFGPLGIAEVSWQKADSDHYHTDGGLYLLPRDMARLGYLMLRDGIWDGKQILPPDWVQQATTAHFSTPGGWSYGYQWWVSQQLGIYSARGHYDQAIYVVPEADLVVVFTANIADEAIHPQDTLLIRYILAACQDLPADFTRLRYEDFGFKLDHGAEFSPLEVPDPILGPPSAAAGTVQFTSLSYPIELLIVSWDESTNGQDSEIILQQSVDEIEDQFGLVIEKGDISNLELAGHRIPTQPIAFEAGELAFSGLSGIWSCPDSQRRYHLTYLSDVVEDTQNSEIHFKEIFSSFSCQEIY